MVLMNNLFRQLQEQLEKSRGSPVLMRTYYTINIKSQMFYLKDDLPFERCWDSWEII